MVRQLGFLCAALLFASAPARAAALCEPAGQRPGAQSSQKNDKSQSDNKSPSGREGWKKFWMDPELRAELGISDQQSAALEKEFQHTFAQRKELNDRLGKADAILQKMLLEDANEAAVVAQLDKVEAARSEANKARMLLLYRMNKLLTLEQRGKLEKMRANRERDGGRRGGGPR